MPRLPRTVSDLCGHSDTEPRWEFLFFWGHTPARGHSVGRWVLSQWFPSSFEVEGVRYLTAEHFMMAEKARLFGDLTTRERILRCSDPRDAKQLGRQVDGFDEGVWVGVREEVVYRGNVAKFGQNRSLSEFLKGTSDKVLVEASPQDRVWGIGLAETHEDARRPERWLGSNLLGFSLMRVRTTLAAT